MSFLSQGAFWGLVTGLLLGGIRLVLDFVYPEPWCGEADPRPGVVRYMHYLYFSMVLAAISTLTVLVVSMLTEPPSEEMVRHPFSFLFLLVNGFQDAPCYFHGNNVGINNLEMGASIHSLFMTILAITSNSSPSSAPAPRCHLRFWSHKSRAQP